jgi:hypothetical protein
VRKVELNVVSAFYKGQARAESNTLTNDTELRLFGHLIARKHAGLLQVRWAGYATCTTRSRLNAVCDIFSVPHRFNIKDRTAHHNGAPVDSEAWITLGVVPGAGKPEEYAA